ncbi:MAG TPA: potassium-transporting ATPase subunit KdpC [Tepidisphaeraceae bacterium]|jgi:K+-transporting ATPase ATPase C chain
MRSQIRPTITVFLLVTIITGLIYPALVTIIAQAAFPKQASGSVIIENGKAVGSTLIGQPFSDRKYFWSRPSATSPVPYAADNGSGSNLGPTNPALFDAIKARIAALRAADPRNNRPVPVDLVTASGSGLDPDISVAAANFQADRVARVRGLALEHVMRLIHQFTEERTFGLLGERRVNVLELNLALDRH